MTPNGHHLTQLMYHCNLKMFHYFKPCDRPMGKTRYSAFLVLPIVLSPKSEIILKIITHPVIFQINQCNSLRIWHDKNKEMMNGRLGGWSIFFQFWIRMLRFDDVLILHSIYIKKNIPSESHASRGLQWVLMPHVWCSRELGILVSLFNKHWYHRKKKRKKF